MDKSKYTVLIVDDVLNNTIIINKILTSVGYNIITAANGQEALEIVNSRDIDLILLDIMMPVLSGIEVCRYLKIEPKTADIPVIFLTASDDRDMLATAYKVGAADYIRKPFFKDELLARVHNSLSLRDHEINLENKIIEKTKDIADTQIELMYTLGGIAEGHSPETFKHVKRVTEFTYLLARLYGMDKKEALTLRDAASLHDVGKLGIIDTILHKQGKLTNAEYKIMKKHVDHGVSMLEKSNLPLFKIAKIVAGEHHEKYDGTGYPQGLKGEEIHIYGRIVAIADVFDALSFKRAYKDSWTTNDVLSYMKEMSGSHFDPNLINIFFDNIDEFLKIYDIHNHKIELDRKFNTKKRNKIMNWLLQELRG